MKKIIITFAILVVPILTIAQNNDKKDKVELNTIVKTEVVVKKVEPISANPKVQNKTINFKKSNDLISIKAYMKSLQMKRKETLMS